MGREREEEVTDEDDDLMQELIETVSYDEEPDPSKSSELGEGDDDEDADEDEDENDLELRGAEASPRDQNDKP